MDRFVIFGASGDLTSRYLIPALARLHECGYLPDELSIHGISRSEWTNDQFREHVRENVGQWEPDIAEESREAVCARLEYTSADVTAVGEIGQIVGTGEPVIAYLALPPSLFAPTIETLAEAGMAEESRIVVEKPFGEDLQSARELNRLILRHFPECLVFRLDHFLGKQTVQNILGLRFANRIFEPVWNRQHIERVDIVWDETLTLEGRAGYYDRAGALKDMIQNHLLQLMALLAMDPPSRMDERDLRDRKAAVLRAVHALAPDETQEQTLRARYTKGRIENREVPSYVQEEGIDPARGTETFAQVTLTIDSWRWAGVPFTLRSGKALGAERKEIRLHFREAPHLAFDNRQTPEANVLTLAFDPDTVRLGVNINGPGDPLDLERVSLDTELAPQSIPAYGRLLLDVIAGDPTFSIRDDEAEESWRIVAPVLEAWNSGLVPLREYPAGSEGPAVPKTRLL